MLNKRHSNDNFYMYIECFPCEFALTMINVDEDLIQ